MIDKFIAWHSKASFADRVTADVLIGVYLICLMLAGRVLWQVALNVVTYGTWYVPQ